MTWYPDLGPCDYFGPGHAPMLRAVGWLERDKPFPTGDVSEEVFRKLCQLSQNPWNPPIVFCGFHQCELCRFSSMSGGSYEKYSISSLASSSIFVPGDKVIYICPTSITHYMDAHGYCPPEEFCAAVLACPPMRSMPYLKALLANGGRGLQRVPIMAET
jgi:hypothetical protein